MSAPTKINANQIVDRDILQQIFPYVPGQLLDTLLRSIDLDLTVPLRADASSTPNLVVTIGPAIVNNTVSGRQKSIPHIENQIPVFTSGTVTFPSADGGMITVSPGSNVTLNCPSGQFNKVLISLDSTGNLIVTQGTPNAVAASVAVPFPVSNTLPICYVILFNNAGTIQNVVQNQIFQFGAGGGGGSGTPQSGFAQEVALSAGATSFTATFPSALPGVNYIVLANFVNVVDGTPQFQEIVITSKTTTGFTASWNAPLDSNNYFIDYLVPVVQMTSGEFPVNLGDTTATISLPLPLGGTNYTVVAGFVNLVDGAPQFQPVEVIAKTASNFTVEWNSPTDSVNYRIAYHLAQYQ